MLIVTSYVFQTNLLRHWLLLTYDNLLLLQTQQINANESVLYLVTSFF